jgi:phytoene dehydrogenase-like protein
MMEQREQVNEYDAILLGSGLASLMAGILLSREKHSVLLLKEKSYEPLFLKDGYHFIPFSNFSERLLRLSTLRGLFQLLSSPLPFEFQKGEELDPPHFKTRREVTFQVILPTARIDLFCDRSRLEEEWKREFPGEIPQIHHLYSELGKHRDQLFPFRQPPSLFQRLFSSESHLDLSPFSQEFRSTLELQLRAWSNFFPKELPTSLASRLLDFGEEGDWVLNSGVDELEKSLWQEYHRAGGHVEEIEGVGKVTREWRKGFTLHLEENRRIRRSRVLVINCPLHRLPNFEGKGGRQLDHWRSLIEPRYVLYPFFFALQEKGIPVGMRDLLVSVSDPGKPYDGGNLLYLSISPEGDRSKAPEGNRALTVESLLPWDKVKAGWNPHWMDEQRESVLRHLGQLVPFLDHHVEFLESDRGRELISQWSYPHFVYETQAKVHWRKGMVPARISRNLYVAGKENLPFLGLEGEILSGGKAGRDVLGKHLD